MYGVADGGFDRSAKKTVVKLVVRTIFVALLIIGLQPANAAERSLPLATELRVGEKVSGSDRLRHYELLAGNSAGFYSGQAFLYQGDTHRFFGDELLLAYGLSDDTMLLLELAYLNAANTRVDPETLRAFGDAHLYARFALTEWGRLDMGGEGGLHLFTGLPGKSDILDGASLSIKQTGTASWDWGSLHYHAGFFYDRSEGVISEQPTLMEATTYGFSGYNHLLAGLRAETRYGPLIPYLEYAARAPIGAPVPVFKGPQWITPGVAVEISETTSLNTGVAVGLTSSREPGVQAALPWTAQLGVSTRFDLKDVPYRLRQLIAPKAMMITVAAKQALNGQMMPHAVITIFTPTGPVRDKGGVTWTGYADTVSYTAFQNDYLPITGVTALRGGQSVSITVAMTPIVGWAKGSAINLAGAEPISLYFNESSTATWSGTGPFQLSVKPGTYSGFATAPNAVSAPVLFTVGIGQTVDLPRLELRKPKPVVPVIVIPELPPENAPERATAVTSLIEMLAEQNRKAEEVQKKEEPLPVIAPVRSGMSLDDFAGQGASLADFVPGSWVLDSTTRARIAELARLVNADSRVRYVLIQGSADDVGSFEVNTMISRQRAEAVRDELKRLGVPADKLGVKISVFMAAPFQMTAKDKQGQRQVVIKVSREGEE